MNNGRPGGLTAALGVAGFPGHSTLASLFYNSWETPTAGDTGERHKASDSLEGGSLVLAIPTECQSRLGDCSGEREQGSLPSKTCPKCSRAERSRRCCFCYCSWSVHHKRQKWQSSRHRRCLRSNHNSSSSVRDRPPPRVKSRILQAGDMQDALLLFLFFCKSLQSTMALGKLESRNAPEHHLLLAVTVISGI